MTIGLSITNPSLSGGFNLHESWGGHGYHLGHIIVGAAVISPSFIGRVAKPPQGLLSGFTTRYLTTLGGSPWLAWANADWLGPADGAGRGAGTFAMAAHPLFHDVVERIMPDDRTHPEIDAQYGRGEHMFLASDAAG